MNYDSSHSGIHFKNLRTEAERQGCLNATPDGLDALDKWLESKNLWSKEAREYKAERIHLLGSRHVDRPFTTRLIDYLTAYGTRLIWNTATEIRAKEDHLHRIVTSIRDASQESFSPSTTPLLYDLFVDALSKQGTAATHMANPRQIVNEDSLIQAAPRNSLLKLKQASELCVIGDLHGDASTARTITDWLRGKFSRTGTDIPTQAVFLGDYVNNGLQSIGVLEEVLHLEKEHPERVSLLSGNHEFGETYATALTELFKTHWDQWLGLSAYLTPEWKTPPGHYGHLRLDLAVRFGAEVGEAVHRKFELWGRSLPLCALHEGTFMCHSIGSSDLHSTDLLNALKEAKGDHRDVRKLVFDGYEAWKKEKKEWRLHASMVNNREITAHTLQALGTAVGAKLFLVGHSHYRSGDRDVIQGPNLGREMQQEPGYLATICSSHPRSRDAGHYIAREFEWTRKAKLEAAEVPEPSRECVATACVAVLKGSPACLGPGDLVPLHQLQGA